MKTLAEVHFGQVFEFDDEDEDTRDGWVQAVRLCESSVLRPGDGVPIVTLIDGFAFYAPSGLSVRITEVGA